MATDGNWSDNDFGVFATTARLGSDFMKQTVATDGTINYQAEHDKFTAWVKALRTANAQNPPSAGIKPAFVDSVRRLIEAFFFKPDPATGQPPAEPHMLAVLDEEYPMNSGERRALPIHVSWGAQDHVQDAVLPITDVATAIGYIFSVAELPAGASWKNYLLPLLFVYSRCLFRAFLQLVSLDNGGSQWKYGGSPVMTCLMYGSDLPTKPDFVGSTPGRLLTSSAANQGADNAMLKMLDGFRRQYLDDQLRNFRGQETPPPLISQFAPRFWNLLADQLRILLNDTLAFKNAPSDDARYGSYIQTLSAIEHLPLEQYVVLKNAQILNHKIIGIELQKRIVSVLKIRLDPHWDDTDSALTQKLETAFKDFLSYYYMPHIFMLPDTTFQLEHPGQAAAALSVEPYVEQLWSTNKQHALDALKTLAARVADNTLKEHTPFGRCAETYCVTCMMPIYYPGFDMSTTHGISMNVSVLGQSQAFQTEFKLSTMVNSKLYRLPCINCQELLPLFRVITGAASYDQEIVTLPGFVPEH